MTPQEQIADALRGIAAQEALRYSFSDAALEPDPDGRWVKWEDVVERIAARQAAAVLAMVTFSDEVLDAAEDAAVAAGNARTNGMAFDLSDANEAERTSLRDAALRVLAAHAEWKTP